ncbi:DUF5683 domain-containing protein [Reichenbachiella carrageenanivorans]|uniref:DUF5683 domain-containing protein n=1 Tax=Reichenbachiella carrageenanivorans TaxID=2979869 RepID=A0ABY6CX85_9BACT|nr:DUF5683 domain-containing protein [Reichenbachiella carrageenanivorans]UXX78537.1 DUF5683 domain-containing protein [Reichenbachiella carrageenanivorans]
MKSSVIVWILCLTGLSSVMAQDETIIRANTDTTVVISDFGGIETFQSKSTLDPDKAALYSAVFPGLGQMYNKQYWKLPIVYGGAMVIGHFIKYNNDFYNAFRNAYIAETDGDESTTNPFEGQFSEEALQLNAERFKRNRDFMVIMGVVYYLVQIVDAHVSAHLIEFNINDDLALQPTYYPREEYFAQNVGMSLVLKLK